MYAAEFSTIFKYVRSFLRTFSIAMNMKTPPLLRLLADLSFVLSFFLCRVLPMIPGLILSLNCKIFFCDFLLQTIWNAFTISKLYFLRDGVLFFGPHETGGDRMWKALQSSQAETQGTEISLVVASMYWGFGLLNVVWSIEILRLITKSVFGGPSAGAKKVQ